MLASRIQGFGNVDPPPLEDETGKVLAKRAVGRLGDMVGEEVMLTVEDFREKGAVGAVKDAVADAGDILIDGVAGLIGWIRGDPEEEEGTEATEAATTALSNGPNGAAYGISQASPTGGINAVWVMPEEADPSTMAMLAQQQGALGGLAAQQSDPRVPKNIQPYQPLSDKNKLPPLAPQPSLPGGIAPYQPAPYQPAPGGPVITPYQPAPAGFAGVPPAPFAPGSGLYTAGVPRTAGGYNSSFGAGASSSSSSAGAKGLIERIAKGEVIVGPEVAKRLVSQCQAMQTTGKQLAEMICERTRRLYLGLDGGDPADADAAMARLLGLVDVLQSQPNTELVTVAIALVRKGVPEELLSLRSSIQHKDSAEPMLQRLGLMDKAPETVDLLGGVEQGSSSSATPVKLLEADLLGEAEVAAIVSTPAPVAKADLGWFDEPAAAAAPASSAIASSIAASAAASDLLSSLESSPAPAVASAGIETLDPLLAAPMAPLGEAPLAVPEALAAPSPSLVAALAPTSPAAEAVASPVSPVNGAMGSMAQGATYRKDQLDAFDFVGQEMSKATASKS